MKSTKAEFEKMVKICERAEALDIAPAERITLIMDLDNTHQSIGLNLDALLEADDLDFSHDIVGIRNHMNRQTKELDDCFVPRYALQKNVDIDTLIDNAKVQSNELNNSLPSGKSDSMKEFE